MDQLALGGQVGPPGRRQGVWLGLRPGVGTQDLRVLLMVRLFVWREGEHPLALVVAVVMAVLAAAAVGVVLLMVGVVLVLLVVVVICWLHVLCLLERCLGVVLGGRDWACYGGSSQHVRVRGLDGAQISWGPQRVGLLGAVAVFLALCQGEGG